MTGTDLTAVAEKQLKDEPVLARGGSMHVRGL